MDVIKSLPTTFVTTGITSEIINSNINVVMTTLMIILKSPKNTLYFTNFIIIFCEK